MWTLRVDNVNSCHARVTFFDYAGANLGTLCFEVQDFESFCFALRPAKIRFRLPIPEWWEYWMTDVKEAHA